MPNPKSERRQRAEKELEARGYVLVAPIERDPKRLTPGAMRFEGAFYMHQTSKAPVLLQQLHDVGGSIELWTALPGLHWREVLAALDDYTRDPTRA